ncbi:hypothetical protein A1A1_00570 [Planococcus antarcticus DSM 14505]|uniref:DUF3238 domain-containing protein n=1 Tax=Planococcus antarcticus DSM 14505 TaxID=1185653 RepID=A0A1C7DCD5_9BACL|nr:DUF3238 domain-containing protein [Planococcus antarcticus]ANU09114.1 hypothetical protein BBH88_01595 [Planococcus antarcticus DSM 14505]EIM08544.1 hypothetical protein A1A1_00570 [Planococcus antarcticus DSM 14505]
MVNELDILVLEQSDTMIYFRWTATEDVCRVKRDEHMVYTGTQNLFKDEGLKKGELYTYTLERLDASGNWTDKIKLHTGTENRKPDSINRLEEIVLTAIVSEERISLAWGEIEGITKFDVYRNSQLIETVDSNQYTDRQVPMDQEFTYWIRGKRPIAKSEERFSEENFTFAKIFGSLSWNSSKQKAAMEEFWLTKKLASLDSLLSDVEKPKIYPVWHFRYQTFLPELILKNPNLLSPFPYFQGDGREFDPESLHYRTRVNFTVDLKEEKSLFSYDKDVGPTIGYNWRKKFSKADVASAEGIELEKIEETGHKVSITLTHGVGNPITTSPNIDYKVSAAFYRDGSYDIIGMHDQSPNHEVYLDFGDNGEWMEIHQTESEGLAYMAGPLASQYWRISNFY